MFYCVVCRVPEPRVQGGACVRVRSGHESLRGDELAALRAQFRASSARQSVQRRARIHLLLPTLTLDTTTPSLG